jgi:hypothetical protein
MYNENRETQVSKRTVQRSLYQEGYIRRVVKKKVRIREVNRKKRVKWAREKLHWRIEGQWDRVIFSDESSRISMYLCLFIVTFTVVIVPTP